MKVKNIEKVVKSFHNVFEDREIYNLAVYAYFLFSIIVGFITKMIVNEDNIGPQFFADTNKIINMIKYNIFEEGSFGFTARFFAPIYFQNIYVMRIILFIFSLIALFYVFSKSNIDKFVLYIITFSPMMMLFNIYNNDISKEYIQFWFYFIVITILEIKDIYLKYTLIATAFITFALLFRLYIIIILLLFIIFRILISSTISPKLRIGIVSLFIILFLLHDMLIRGKISVIDQVIQVRIFVNHSRLLDGVNVTTIVNDVIPNNNSLLIFVLNTIINFIRFLFPVELILKLNMKYIFACIYQLIISFGLLRKVIYVLKNKNKVHEGLIMIFAILLTQAVFEPDYGSYFKHQSACVLFYFKILYEK